MARKGLNAGQVRSKKATIKQEMRTIKQEQRQVTQGYTVAARAFRKQIVSYDRTTHKLGMRYAKLNNQLGAL